MNVELTKETLDRAVKLCGGSDAKLGQTLDRTDRQIRNYRKQGRAPKIVVNAILAIVSPKK